MKDESLAIRRLTNFVFQFAGAKGNFDDYWPLDGRERMTIEPPTREWWARMKEKQIPIDKKIADARLKSNSRR